MKPTTKKKLKTLLYIAALFIVIGMFEWWGFWGALVFIIVMIAYKLYTQRESFLVALRDTETRIWGKPLEKEIWDKNEMKNTKLKFVWRKDRNETKEAVDK